MPFVTPDDVRALQRDIAAQDAALTRAFLQCTRQNPNPIDPNTARDWAALDFRVQEFLQEDPSWLNTAAQMDRGQQLQRELLAWYDRFRSLGCSYVPPTPPPPPAPADLFTSIAETLKYAAIIYILYEVTRVSRR